MLRTSRRAIHVLYEITTLRYYEALESSAESPLRHYFIGSHSGALQAEGESREHKVLRSSAGNSCSYNNRPTLLKGTLELGRKFMSFTTPVYWEAGDASASRLTILVFYDTALFGETRYFGSSSEVLRKLIGHFLSFTTLLYLKALGSSAESLSLLRHYFIGKHEMLW